MLDNFKHLRQLLEKSEKRNILIFIPLTLLLVLIETLSVGLIVPIITFFFESENFGNLNFLNNFLQDIPKNDLLKYLLCSLVFIYLIKNLYVIYYNWIRMRFANFVQLRISSQLLKIYFRAPYSKIFHKNSAELLRNIQVETAKVRNIINHMIILLSEILIVIGIAILLFLINFNIVFYAFIYITLSFIIYYLLIRNKVKKLGFENQRITQNFLRSILQKISSLKLVRIFLNDRYFLKEFEEDMSAFQNNNLKLGIINLLPKMWMEVFGIAFLSMMLIFLINQTKDMNYILSLIGLIVVAAVRIIPSPNRIMTSIQQLKYTTATFEKISDDLSISMMNFDHNLENIDFKKEILIKDINFSFQETGRNIFKNLNFKINKGEIVCIKGISGSGKSTFANLISGLLKPESGFFLVDGKNINTDNLNWMSKIGYVTQETYLLDDSIKNNIAFGISKDLIDIKKIHEVIEKVQLGELIKSLPEKMDTVIGERGSKLSMGQIQRIGIARALYTNSEILILDEITSSLDEKNTNKIFDLVSSMKTSKTIIVITHEFLNKKIFDSIYELKNHSLQKTE